MPINHQFSTDKTGPDICNHKQDEERHFENKKLNRRQVEKTLCEHLDDCIAPFIPDTNNKLGKFKDGTFGLSALSMALYANGQSPRGTNPDNPCGLLYHDGQAAFGIGFFSGCLHLIAPRGENSAASISHFRARIRKIGLLKSIPIYVRHLKHQTFTELLHLGWLDARERPFLPEAPLEDETFPASIISLNTIITEQTGSSTIRQLEGRESKGFRSKNIRCFNSFSNFMKRNNISLELREYRAEDKQSAHFIGKQHFEMLEKNAKAIGSCWADYSNLVNPDFLHPLGNSIFSRIGYLRRDEHRVPFMLFIGEDLSQKKFGLYCSLTLRYPEIVCPMLGLTTCEQGFRSNASTFAHLMFFRELLREGYQEVNLGGSETADLNRFKRRLGARNAPSYWAVSLL